MIDNQQVGRNLMLLRLQKGLSQQGLAEVCSVTHQAVSKWENGAALPDVETMLFLSGFYGVAMEEILTGDISMDAEEEAKTPAAQESDAWDRAAEEKEERQLPAIQDAAAQEAVVQDAVVQEAEPTADSDGPTMGREEIIELAPFASRETLGKLTQKLLSEGRNPDWGLISQVIPFLGRETLERIMDQCGDRYAENEDALELLTAVAPFVSKEYLEKVVNRVVEKNGAVSMDVLRSIAVFLPKRAVDTMILQYLKPRHPDSSTF